MTKKIGLYRCKTTKGVQWRVRWFGEYKPNTGKQKRYSKTFALRKDAERFIKVKDAEFERGSPRDWSKVTLREYCQWWLQYRAKGLRAATVGLYQGTIKRLCDYFGDILLRNITPQVAEMFFAELRPINGNKSLSSWTRHQIMRQCKTLFGDAADRDFILRNPFKKIKAPKTSVSPWYYINPVEYNRLLTVTPSTKETAFYALCYTAGLRLTEAIAIRWADIDFETGQVNVVKYSGTETLPPFYIKDNEIRSIPLPKQTITLLLKLQTEAPENVPYALMSKTQYENIIAKWQKHRKEGQGWLNRDYANNILKRFRKRVRRAGIKTGGKSLTIHTLRKCCCQNWIQAGLPINVVKMLMGHADIGTTEKHYSQVTKEQREQVATASTASLQVSPADTTDQKMTFLPDFACKDTDDK